MMFRLLTFSEKHKSGDGVVLPLRRARVTSIMLVRLIFVVCVIRDVISSRAAFVCGFISEDRHAIRVFTRETLLE